jgi:hypothetical protein
MFVSPRQATHDDGRHLFSGLNCPDIVEHLGQLWLGQSLGSGESLHYI